MTTMQSERLYRAIEWAANMFSPKHQWSGSSAAFNGNANDKQIDVERYAGRSHRQDQGVMLIMSIMGYID